MLMHLRDALCRLSSLCVQIQAAFQALRNTRGLPWPKEHDKKPDADLLGWLQAMFGFQVITLTIFSRFISDTHARNCLRALNPCPLTLLITLQKDNVSNQREHLILLLANVHIRQIPKPDQQPKVYTSTKHMRCLMSSCLWHLSISCWLMFSVG